MDPERSVEEEMLTAVPIEEEDIHTVLPLMKYAREVCINLFYRAPQSCQPFFDYATTDDFFKAVKVSFFVRWDIEDYLPYIDSNMRFFTNADVYLNFPSTRQMKRAWTNYYRHIEVEETVFLNPLGLFGRPPDDAIKRT